MLTQSDIQPDVVVEVEELLAKVEAWPDSDDDVEFEVVRRLVEEVKTLRKRVKTMERDTREEAQAAANEARWQERQGEDYGSY